jgi:hypothetical protein
MRLLCLPYFQETGGTHRFSGRGFLLTSGGLTGALPAQRVRCPASASSMA